ncbi:dihydroorotate dehydrogenase (quinone) [Saccharomonospora sp. CUA-673]|uniref:quinone-dependent dihydroorotate dehydrogenase n=1 Tax=Saccharomonospora sp. CUA-673 TaxID=1904969 RepID=UPI00096871A7|nr:quinone-dependent dihydroorotate dehydrogenase [Saccharomonospora sp. CUA-673]OLT44844.1 dihydroorotate dehydrogenase (quinone) [Saccharomonospora sp. CUA-673]
MFFDSLVRPALYRLHGDDAERVHERALQALSVLGSAPQTVRQALRRVNAADDAVTVFGVRFPGRVGLAAGMDKDGRALRAWPALGFGFVEVGTVTRHAQPGNPRPRLFALPASDAVINRMGFNNGGADALAARLGRDGRPDVPLGVSIGKSKVTPIDDAVADYRTSLQALHPFADYVAINVSSPNTPGLRALQDRDSLAEILAALRDTAPRTPLLVKVAPDLTDDALGELLQVCTDHGVAGIIATNTTLRRDGLASADTPVAAEQGGLSGRPLTRRALDVVRFVHTQTSGELPIIGVGGIGGPADAEAMLDAGAALVQVYTAFALHGPALVRRINRTLAAERARWPSAY